MIKIFLIFIFFSLSSIDDIITSLKSGNSSEIGKYIDTNIDIRFGGIKKSYNKKDAITSLDIFFNNNPIIGFNVIHKGKSQNGSQYCIGNLITKNKSFRTTIFMKQMDNVQILQEINFE